MPTSRRAFLTVAAAATAATAGCTDLVFGDGLEIEATAASVAEATLDDTGYEHHETTDQTIEREFEAGGESRTATVTNKHAQYDKAIDLGMVGLGRQRAAAFSVLTTPRVEVLGESFNPVEEWDAEQIVDQAQQRYEDFGNFQEVGETEVEVLGETTTATEFEGEAALSGTGQTVDLTMHVCEAVESGEDFAVAIAAYPTRLDGSEREDAFAMFSGVEHDG